LTKLEWYRNVFSSRRKVMRDDEDRTTGGRLFQARGAAAGNELYKTLPYRYKSKQGNRIDYTSPALCIPVTPFAPIGDAAYHQHAGGGPRHGHRQHAQKLIKIAHVVPEISWRTDRPTDRYTHHNTSQRNKLINRVVTVNVVRRPSAV